MEYLLVALGSCLASLLTFYSGFGLGTILMPVVALFFPLPIAIALTAVVHLIHNLVKASFLWKAIDWKIAFRFGLISSIASIPGALILRELSALTPVYQYQILFLHGQVSFLHISIGILFILFAALEKDPNRLRIDENLLLSGVISGFFGGLSGNQGAFRSAFLVKSNLNKEAYIGTSAIIAAAVDIVRLTIYGLVFWNMLKIIQTPLLSTAIGSALIGNCFGMFFLGKVSFSFIKNAVTILLYLFGLLFIIGII